MFMTDSPKNCSIISCTNNSITKGLCGNHYRNYRTEQNKKKGKICKHDGCNRGFFAKWLCVKHYAAKNFSAKITEEKNKQLGKICKIKGCNNGIRSKGYCNNHASRVEHKKTRDMIFKHLGQDKCQKCGFGDKRAFTLDHIHDDGKIDRKEWKKSRVTSGLKKYVMNPELARKKLQVLCMNCNFIKEVERQKKITGYPDLDY